MIWNYSVTSIIVCLLLSVSAYSQQTWWQHDPDLAGDWFVDEHWSNGIPAVAGYAYIDNGGTAHVSAGLVEAENLYVGYFGYGQFLQPGFPG